MVEYSKVNVILTDIQLKKTEKCCQKQNSDNSENEFESVWRKWSASWVITDNKIKSEAKKCI